jgi:foldase protein PrsA
MIAFTLILLTLLTACRSGGVQYELSDFMGKSVSSFEKKSGIKLEEQSNGAYLKKGVVSVLVSDKKVTSITLLENAGKYTLFGASIGMAEDTAAGLLSVNFGKEASKAKENGNNTVTYVYPKGDEQLCISYDKDKKTVITASYYNTSAENQNSSVTAEPDSDEMMLEVGGVKVYYNEARIYVKLAQNQYETDYGNGIWKADILGNGENFGKMIKQEVINQITELKVIQAEAKKQEISLTEEEKADADAYAKEQYESISKQDRQKYQITQELLQQVYYDNLLANKMYETLTLNVDNNVSDAEARQITVQDIFVQNYNLDAEGKQVALSEEDKTSAYNKVKSLLAQAKETKDFKALAEANSEAEELEYTFGKGKAPKEFGDVFENAAFSLKTGETSDIITTDKGWHIIYCVSDFNEDATTQVKENIIEQRRSDMFSELYTKWSADDKVVVNQEAWDAIPLGE